MSNKLTAPVDAELKKEKKRKNKIISREYNKVQISRLKKYNWSEKLIKEFQFQSWTSIKKIMSLKSIESIQSQK